MLVEGPETVLLSLHAPTGGGILGAQPTAVLTIADRAGTVQFAKAAVTTPEFARSVRLTLTRTGPAGSTASVPYHLAGKTTAVGRAEQDRLSRMEEELQALRREVDELKEAFAAFRKQFE